MIQPISQTYPIQQSIGLENHAAQIFTLIEKGDLKTLRAVMRIPQDLEICDLFENTPLHHACCNGQLEIVRFLVKNKAQINLPGIFKCTPLMLAAQNNHADMCRYLIAMGADVDAEDERKRTALHHACMDVPESTQDRKGTIQILLDSGADFSKRTEEPSALTPVEFAAYYNQLHVLTLFKKAGADCILDLHDLYDKVKGVDKLPKVLDVYPYNTLNKFFVSQKMTALSYGVNCRYVGRDKKTVSLVGSLLSTSLEGVIELVERTSLSKKEAYMRIMKCALSVIHCQTKGTMSRDLLQSNQNEIQSFLLGIKIKDKEEYHAVTVVFSRHKRLLLKGDRGGNGLEPGLHLYKVGRPERLDEVMYYFARNVFSLASEEFFYIKMDQFLELEHVARFPHKYQKIGKCAVAASKLMIRGISFLDLVDNFKLSTAEEASRFVYKTVSQLDRQKDAKFFSEYDTFNRFANKHKLIDSDLEAFGIIPKHVFFGIFLKHLNKENLPKMDFYLDKFPEFLEMTTPGFWQGTPLIQAACEGKPKAFLNLLKRGANVNAVTPPEKGSYNAIIFCCAKVQMTSVVQEILKINPSLVNVPETENGSTPLHQACIYNNIPLILYLISMGADPTIKNLHGQAPFEQD